MNSFTLLHIGQQASGVMTVDRAVLTLAVGAMLGACAVIWRFDLLARAAIFRRRVRRRVGSVLVAALLAFAVFPIVVPYDHIFSSHDDAHAAAEDAGGVHASHCHTSPGTCSDVPLASGPGQFLTADPLIAVPAMLSILVVATMLALAGRTPSPEVRPPLRLRNFSTI